MEKPKKIVTNKPEVVFEDTQRTIAMIEKKLKAPLIVYFNGSGGKICGNDAIVMHKILNGKKYKHIYFYITSDGGSGIASLKIVSMLRNYCDKISVLITSECASAATMLALGADEIIMGPLANLSAVDSSLTHDLSPVTRDNYSVSVSMDELNRVLKLWKDNSTNCDTNPYKDLYNYIHPLVFGAVDRASSLSFKICREILRYHMNDEEKINQIANKLNTDYPSHNYPILFREAKEVGLNVSMMNDDLVKDLHDLSILYAKMCDRKFTDYDENSYHDSTILNVIENNNWQIYYQVDQDRFYRTEERRWINMNDESAWFINFYDKNKIKNERIHIR